jgi:hypothetical protein
MSFRDLISKREDHPRLKVMDLEGITQKETHLKLYWLGEINERKVKHLRTKVASMLRIGDIEMPAQSGFAIYSPSINYLNVIAWGYPQKPVPSSIHVAMPQLFELSANYKAHTRLDPVKEGAFCSYEGVIIGEESRLWNEMLRAHNPHPWKYDQIHASRDII